MEIGAGKKGKKKEKKVEEDKPVETPKQYFFDMDWREYLDSEVRKQSGDVCWAIAVAGSVEGRFNMNSGEDVPGIVLSPQVLIDAVTKNKNEDHVTSAKKAFSVIQQDGICKESRRSKLLPNEKTNKQEQEADKDPTLNRNIFVGNLHGQSPTVDAVDEEELYACLSDGPVVGYLETCEELANFRGTGVYSGPFIRGQNKWLHAVIICGAGRDEDGNKFWLIKNSDGPAWGDNGFGKVIRLSDPGKSIFWGYNYADVI